MPSDHNANLSIEQAIEVLKALTTQNTQLPTYLDAQVPPALRPLLESNALKCEFFCEDGVCGFRCTF